MVRPLAFVILGVLLLLPRQEALGADSSFDDRGESTAVELLATKIKETKEGIAEGEGERRKILGSLYAITQRMKKISLDKGRLTDDLMQSQDSVNSVASAINALEGQILKQRTTLHKRLRALYKLSGESYIGILFSQSNAYEFDSTMRNLRIISDNDYQIIKSYRKNVKTLAAEKRKLKSQVERLLTIERRIKRQEKLLEHEHKAKSELAATIEATTKAKLREIQKLRQKSALPASTIADLELERLLKPSIFEKKGTLGSPVLEGAIARDFGLFVDPDHHFKLSHKGWKIAVGGSSGAATSVIAVEEGKVAYSGLLPGYGNTLIVDHADHYYSIYAGLSELKAKSDSVVQRGEILGRARDHLYFEFRHFSEPENPAGWISAKSPILASFSPMGKPTVKGGLVRAQDTINEEQVRTAKAAMGLPRGEAQ